MRKEEYIQEVISRIENKRAKIEVEKELSAHIDDRISYYTDAGWDKETANEKALEHMGEAKEIGEQMALVHSKIKFYSYFSLLPLVLFSFITFFILMFSQDDGLTVGALMIPEPILILLLFGTSLFGRKKESKIISFVPILIFLLYIVEHGYISLYSSYNPLVLPVDLRWDLSRYASSVVVTAIYLFTLKFGAINDTLGLCYPQFAPWVTALSIAFYSLVALLLIASFISVCISYSRKTERFVKTTKRITQCFAVFSAVVLVSVFVSFSIPIENVLKTEYSNYFIIENDEQINVTENDIQKGSWMSVDWDWSEYIESVSLYSFLDETYEYEIGDGEISELVCVDYNSIVSHYIQITDIYYKTTKKYVYVVPGEKINGKYVLNKKSVWINTDEKDLLKIKVDESNYIYLHFQKTD